MMLRLARSEDVDDIARLHAAAVAEGFLPTLGPRFLRLLHRRIVLSSHSFAIVAEDDGELAGVVVASENVGLLYREFLVRDGVRASVAALPRLLRAAGRAFETLRYPTRHTALPPAEILVVAVAAAKRRAGTGGALVERTIAELDHRRVRAVRVVTTASNDASLALYRSRGFRPVSSTEVHRGTESVVLVRSDPSAVSQ